MVPAGPFSIQDLDSSVRGRLDVEVIEQNGRKKNLSGRYGLGSLSDASGTGPV
ncbi:fimbria/pilus outer membrane usher protein [Escherichia coli]|nr:fimbria/pilus outer membrane usher protein [Escherichia coli]